MAITPGSRFGSYEIVESIGAGGMGEVFRVRDSSLKRDVALKVLPQAFVDDADRLARFQREAEILASLNHANIAQVYGLEKAEGGTAIVMELVEGPTLAERIKDGAIPPDEAMGIALQIVSALEAAHDRQIVHRDLKPDNVKLRSDGTIKVLDFGIAKSIDVSSISGQAARMTTPAVTQTGVILGTAAYMSPEQARGLPVDERTDIWAFGCLLYEMLTGQPAFGGEDVMLTLARVLANDTELDSMPGTIAPAVRHTIRLCLEKDPRRRIADIRDVRLSLEGAFEATAGTLTGGLPQRRSLLVRVLPPAAALAVGLLTAGVAVWIVTRPGAPDVARFDLTPANQTIMSSSPSIAISPDGRALAYLTGGERRSGAAELHLRELDRLEPRVLIADSGVASPFFSPDGRDIGFYENLGDGRGYTLKRVSVSDGRVSTITPIPANLRGASWGPDGTIVFATSEVSSGLWSVPALGGDPEVLTTPAAGEGDHLWPDILPAGDAVLFTILGRTQDEASIAVVSRASDEVTILPVRGYSPRYSRTGHLLYTRAGALWSVAFDPDSLETRGNPVPLEEGVLTKGNGRAAEFTLAAHGSLAYVAGEATSSDRGLVWVDATGEAQPAISFSGLIDDVALSPDGTRAVVTMSPESETPGIFVWDLTRGSSVPLTQNAGGRNPMYSPDGEWIAYGVTREGSAELRWRRADGTGDAELLAAFELPITRVVPASWSPNGSQLALGLIDSDGMSRLGIVTIGDPNSFRAIGPSGAATPAISPNGHWLAYGSSIRGSPQIYVERFPDGGARQAVSIDGGLFPKWSADGQALTYVRIDSARGPDSMKRVTIAGEEAADQPLRIGEPTELFPWENYYSPQASFGIFDMLPNGERFLLMSGRAQYDVGLTRTILVQNWPTELEELQRLPTD